ncbi:MAG: cytochrome c biogenesis protein ResB [Nitrospiraceae bacterium]|nr:MAG: cytochrome c biogenesis protein ResB [Nitrospiraceae bacterium]
MNKIYDFLRSVKLALILFISILISCVTGVMFFPDQQAKAMIFSSLWFNSLLILLVVNIGFCFFSRVWRRKITPVSLGMILFHLSFVLIFAGIVYNSLFYFNGAIRLSEGETLSNTVPQSYDLAEWGRFFNHARLKGDTTLVKLHTHYKVNSADKGVANQILVGDGNDKKEGFVYITNHMDYNGFRYFRDRDGFSLLIILYDKHGRERYGAFVPLQSLKQKDGTYLYTSGTAVRSGSFPFPQDPLKPLLNLQISYSPDPQKERAGHVYFQVWPFREGHHVQGEKIIAKGEAALREKFTAGDYFLSVHEVRYWASMNVRYDPGLLIILTSFWIGLGGMILTTIARLARSRKRQDTG